MTRYVLLPLLAALLLTACGRTDTAPPPDPTEADPEVVVPEHPQEITGEAEALLGTWVITEQAGAAPDRIYTVTFTRTGEYIVRDDTRTQQTNRFRPLETDVIAVQDSLGAEIERYVYDVDGNVLTLTIPGSEATTVLERREDLIQNRPELTPGTQTPAQN